MLLLVLLSLNMQKKKPNIEYIYVGKSFLWTVYFDSLKTPQVVEVSGVKFGYLDYLNQNGDGKSGELYYKKGKLYYKNESLNIDMKLDQKEYSAKIDNQRQKIFEINAFNEISRLKDSLSVDYKFDWNVRNDYIYYRDNHIPKKDYKPDYIVVFYKRLK